MNLKLKKLFKRIFNKCINLINKKLFNKIKLIF